MMRLGISCNDAGHVGRFKEKAYLKLREYGFSAVDFNAISNTDTAYYTLPESRSDELLLRHRRLCEEAGLEIFQVHGPWRWPPFDGTPEGREERLEKMKKSIRMASILGAKYWVVHPIMPFGVDDIGTGNEQATWELNRGFMGELLKTAHEYDVTICLENMPMLDFSLATPEKILEFVKEMDDDLFRICLDTGHVQVFASRGIKLDEETRRLGNYIKCLHVHDNKQERDLHLFPTFGNADWKDFSKALNDIGYDGVFSLETAPPDSVSDELYEDMTVLLVRIVREILGYEGF